jgi:hypothetical protein
MLTLHDATYRSQLAQRIGALRADSQRRWGKMSVDQMLWHCNAAMAIAVGDVTLPARKPPLPAGILKFMVLKMPWMKGGPTMPELVAKQSYNFESERVRCLRLMEKVASTDVSGEWPLHPALGRMSGAEISRLHAKHLNHHLTQFGV